MSVVIAVSCCLMRTSGAGLRKQNHRLHSLGAEERATDSDLRGSLDLTPNLVPPRPCVLPRQYSLHLAAQMWRGGRLAVPQCRCGPSGRRSAAGNHVPVR